MKMSQNDFYVAIQFVLERAYDSGWNLTDLEEQASDAIDEFIGVKDEELTSDIA